MESLKLMSFEFLLTFFSPSIQCFFLFVSLFACFFFNFRAQDKAAIQLSELEEEMDQRIHAVENETRKDVSLWIGLSFVPQIVRELILLWHSEHFSWYQSKLGDIRLHYIVPSRF